MSAGSAEFVYTVESAQFEHELAALGRAQKALRSEIGKAAAESAKGSRAATAAVTLLVAEYEELSQSITRLKSDYASLNVAAGKAASGQGMVAKQTTWTSRLVAQQSQVYSQLAFAVDDALTVFGTQGLAGAMRAAGNNITYVTSIIHPLATVATALGFAVGTVLLPRLWQTADASKEAGKAFDQQKQAIESLREEYAKFGKSSEQFAEEQKQSAFAAAMAEANARQIEIGRQIQAVEAEMEKVRVVGGGPYGGGAIKPGKGEREKIAALREQLAIVRAEQETLQDNERKRRAAVAEAAGKKRAGEIVGTIDAPLRKAASLALKQGTKPAEVQQQVTGVIAGQLPPELQPFAAEQAKRIVAGAVEAEQSQRLEAAAGPIDRTAAMRRRQREVEAQIATIEARRIDAEAAAPRGKLRPRDQRAFDAELEPLRAEQKRLSAQLTVQRNADDLATEQRRQTDVLSEIRDILQAQQPDRDWQMFDREVVQ